MLESLVRYAERRGLGDDPCFEERYAKWAIVLDADGAFRGIKPLGDPEDKRWKGKSFVKTPRTPQNELQSGRKSHFLAEAATTVLLLPAKKDEALDEKYIAKQSYFKDLIKEAVTAGVQSLNPVVNFMARTEDIHKAGEVLLKQKRAKGTDTVTFDVDGRCVLDLDHWHAFWKQKRGVPLGRNQSQDSLMPCLATGLLCHPLDSHGKITGVGASPGGASLVANDKDAFQSYGLKDARNAPVSSVAESRYRAALKELVSRAVTLIQPNPRTRQGGLQFVHWTREEAHADPVTLVRDGEEAGFDFFGGDEQLLEGGLLKALKAVREGDYTPGGYEGNSFYGCALNANGGRIIVRDWWESSLMEVLGDVSEWAEDLSLFKPGGGLLGLPKFGALLYTLVREELNELPPQLPVQLMRAALRGLPLPRTALSRAVYRHKINMTAGRKLPDGSRTHEPLPQRIALIKAYLIRREKGGAYMTQYLNENHPHPAYHCGRLMSVLAALQESALGNVGAGVVQRFYAASSSTPALVFGRLTRTSQFHLSKLPGGLANWYEKKIADIWGRIRDCLPPTLTLEEQSLFAMGYYQQMAVDQPKPSDNKNKTKEVSQ